MSETAITQLHEPSGFTSHAFTDVIRDGARKLIEQAERFDSTPSRWSSLLPHRKAPVWGHRLPSPPMSVRRAASLQVHWPDGLSPDYEMVCRARDLFTGKDPDCPVELLALY